MGETKLSAILEDNEASQTLLEQMPMTLSMTDGDESQISYRFETDILPTGKLREDSYEVGDIGYCPSEQRLMIFYRQNGELSKRQHLGHISEGAEIFKTTGDTEVTFAPDQEVQKVKEEEEMKMHFTDGTQRIVFALNDPHGGEDALRAAAPYDRG